MSAFEEVSPFHQRTPYSDAEACAAGYHADGASLAAALDAACANRTGDVEAELREQPRGRRNGLGREVDAAFTDTGVTEEELGQWRALFRDRPDAFFGELALPELWEGLGWVAAPEPSTRGKRSAGGRGKRGAGASGRHTKSK